MGHKELRLQKLGVAVRAFEGATLVVRRTTLGGGVFRRQTD